MFKTALKKYSNIIVVSAILILAISATYIIKKRMCVIENWMFSDKQIEEYGPFWLTIPALENDGLSVDINGINIEDERDVIYIILPDTVDKKKVVVYVRDGYDSNYEARRVLDFSNGDVELAGKKIKLYHTDFHSIYIETDESINFEEFKRTEDRSAECPGVLYTNKISQKQNIILNPRGNSTWGGTHKKPYSLHFKNKVNLLGDVESKSWNLISDVWDKTLLKNYTFNSLAREMGFRYEPEMEHVLLFINGNFEGVYLLTTKVGKVGKNLSEIPLTEDDMLFVWGGSRPEQIVEYHADGYEEYDEDNWLGSYVDLKFPKNVSEDLLLEKKDIIQKYVDKVYDETAQDYLDYLNVENITSFYWIQEASMNIDAYMRSIYTIYDSDKEKMLYEPVWDMDYTLYPYDDGETERSVTGWVVRKKGFYRQLFEHPGFEDEVVNTYNRLDVHNKLLESIETAMNEQKKIETFARLDYKVWRYEWSNDEELDDCSTYDECVDIVFKRYRDRIMWIQEEMGKQLKNN